MFRDMRRKGQMLSNDECIAILNRGTSGVLALSGDDDYPYAVPLSYAYKDNRIYFHGSRIGHKIDAIKRNPKVSFCVIDQDEVHGEEFTTYFRSVILFGKARIISEQKEIIADAQLLTEKFAPEYIKEGLDETMKAIDALGVVEIDIEHMTGKESKYLVEKRNKQKSL